jgi:hypothetical protein
MKPVAFEFESSLRVWVIGSGVRGLFPQLTCARRIPIWRALDEGRDPD